MSDRMNDLKELIKSLDEPGTQRIAHALWPIYLEMMEND